MFDISALKEMKLPQLQEIAKLAKNIKYFNVKKDILIDLILDEQSKNNSIESIQPTIESEEKPKRARISVDKKPVLKKKETVTLFSEPAEVEIVVEEKEIKSEEKPSEELIIENKKGNKVTKFNKAEYERKMAAKMLKSETVSSETAVVETSENSQENEIESDSESIPQKKINPNQLHKQNPTQNQNGNAVPNVNQNKNKKNNF